MTVDMIQPEGGDQKHGTWMAVLTMKAGIKLGVIVAVKKLNMGLVKVVSLVAIVLQLHVHVEIINTKSKSGLLVSILSRHTQVASLTAAAKAFSFAKPANTSGWCHNGKHYY